MNRLIFVIFLVVLFISAGKSFREEIEQLFNGTNKNMTDELRKYLDVVKNTSAPKGIQDIFHKKGEEFTKLEEAFTKKCTDEFEKKLAELKLTVKPQISGQMNAIHEIFEENYERCRDVAAAEHYREIKPFYDFVCAFRLIDKTLEAVWQNEEYGGIGRAKELMTEMNKKETYKRDSEFSDYVVPGEMQAEMIKFYEHFSHKMYPPNELATKVRQELESIRGERQLEEIVGKFALALAKLTPFAKFVHQNVIPEVRRLAQENYTKQLPINPFVDEITKLMPNKKWYFPREYLDHFNVLGRAFGLRDLNAREYHCDNVTILVPESDQCMERADDHDLYEYMNMYFSTTPRLPPKKA